MPPDVLSAIAPEAKVESDAEMSCVPLTEHFERAAAGQEHDIIDPAGAGTEGHRRDHVGLHAADFLLEGDLRAGDHREVAVARAGALHRALKLTLPPLSAVGLMSTAAE